MPQKLRYFKFIRLRQQNLERNITRVEAQSLVHKAINYALNQWDSLIVYCEDGEITISNAGAENVIRPFCVGRKNWLFADTPRGARASAVFYSLIETAKLHGLEPYDYLCSLLTALPYAETVEQLEALLPWNMKASLAAEKNSSLSMISKNVVY
tara:strand:- start:11 stop:472 length:462 start_codon:yes stop_codon:yes gene_type:complete